MHDLLIKLVYPLLRDFFMVALGWLAGGLFVAGRVQNLNEKIKVLTDAEPHSEKVEV